MTLIWCVEFLSCAMLSLETPGTDNDWRQNNSIWLKRDIIWDCAANTSSICALCHARSPSSAFSISAVTISCEKMGCPWFCARGCEGVWYEHMDSRTGQIFGPPAELCLHTSSYCRAPGCTCCHVSSVSFLELRLTIRQVRFELALTSSPACCIKCWFVKQLCIVNKLSHI